MSEVKKIATRDSYGAALVELAKEYMDEHYFENLSLNDIAGKIGISPAYLSSLFSQQAGITLIDYLNEVRIDHACVYLEQNFFKTYEIAYKVGFRDEKYFSKVFRKVMEMSPSEYKKRSKYGYKKPLMKA